MSSLPPLPARTVPPPGAVTDFVGPLALASLLVCALLLGWFVLQALIAVALVDGAGWRQLVQLASEYEMPPSVMWLLGHPVAASVWLGASCLPSLLSSWGLLRRQRWGLWSYIALLLGTAAGNFVALWWMDSMLVHVIARVTDPSLLHELQVQRGVFSLTLLGTCVLFAALQGWLAWRLLQPDIRRQF